MIFKKLFVMLMKYLALKKGEIILLRWMDIKPTKYTSLHKLRIYRYLNSSEQVIYYTEKGPVEAVREPSLPPTIYAYLIRWKTELDKTKGAQAIDSDMPVFPASVFFPSIADNRFLTYEQANDIESDIDALCGLNETEFFVRLRDQRNPKDINLNDNKGNIYRTDFDFNARFFCLEPGAIDAILGRKSKYTYARHYVDYRDEFIQEMIAMTIERMIAEDSSPEQPAFFTERNILPSINTISSTGKRTVRQFIFSLHEKTTLSMTVTNSYGSFVTIIITRKEN